MVNHLHSAQAPAVCILPPADLDAQEDEVRVTTTIHEAKVHEKHGARQEYILNQYKRGAQIGKGQHGQVFVCYDITRELPPRAMKVVSRKNPRHDRVKELRKHKLPQSGNHISIAGGNFSSTEHKIRKEIAVMKKCRHPHVVRLIEVIDDPLFKKVYMIMEYLAGGEVKWRDEFKNPILTVDQIRRITRDVILGLEYLHQQGIIHRDIKPANLLWTEDRRMVKITDFGVAWMSAAHAARPEPHQRSESSYDDLRSLFDESELCKTAGTPSFLAPEVVYEYGSNELSSEPSEASLTDPTPAHANGDSTATIQQASASRPPITKAVDIWALGVTLYCMLFGVVPFHGDGASEYQIYRMICTEDWDVPPTMGYDRIPTGGRHPDLTAPNPSEGALVVSLLERLLEKDASKRATLAEVKRHPWFMRDIPNVGYWVDEPSTSAVSTAPAHPSASTSASPSQPPSPPPVPHPEPERRSRRPRPPKLPAASTTSLSLPPGVTEREYATAVSSVKFRWDLKNVGKRLTQLIRKWPSSSRPARTVRVRDEGVGIASEPSQAMGRHGVRRPLSAGAELRHYGGAISGSSTKERSTKRSRTPTKKRKEGATPTRHQSQQFHRPSLNVPSPSRSKSVDRPRGTSAAATAAAAGMPASYDAPSTVSSSSYIAGTEDGSTRSFSPAGNSKTRFSVRNLWAGGRSASSLFFPADSSSSSNLSKGRLLPSQRQGSSAQTSVSAASTAPLRTSDETSPTGSIQPTGLSTGYVTPTSPHDAFGVGPQMRAASWGNVADYHHSRGRAHAEEVTSIYSGGGDEAPDDDVMLFGAGGVAHAPTSSAGSSSPPGPFPLFSDRTHSTPVVHATSKTVAVAVPAELMHSVTGRDPAAIADPATQNAGKLPRVTTSKTHTRSPLVHAYHSGDDEDNGYRVNGAGAEGRHETEPSDSDSDFSNDSDDSFFERTSEDAERGRQMENFTLDQGEGDEGDSGSEIEDRMPLEVRRRRPSFGLRGEYEGSDDEDEDDEDDDDSVDIH